MSDRRSHLLSGFGPAPLAAGLLFFAVAVFAAVSAGAAAPVDASADVADSGSDSAAPAPPLGRSIAEGAGVDLSPSAAPTARLSEDLEEQDKRLRMQDKRVRELDGRTQDEALRLSRAAKVLDELYGALASETEARAQLAAALQAMNSKIESLEDKSQAMGEAQSKAAVSAEAGLARFDELRKDLDTLKADLAGSQENLATGLKELEDTRGALSKLDSLQELMTMLKRDMDNDDEELVEVKQSLKRLEPAPSEGSDSAWWEGVASWKYLPALATGLSAIALGVAAFHH